MYELSSGTFWAIQLAKFRFPKPVLYGTSALSISGLASENCFETLSYSVQSSVSIALSVISDQSLFKFCFTHADLGSITAVAELIGVVVDPAFKWLFPR